MTSLTNFALRQPSWKILVCLVGILGLPGCVERPALMDMGNILGLEKNATEEASPPSAPPPSIQDVEEAISSTKNLLDNQQEQLSELLTLRGEVKQTLRELHDQDLSPMKAAIEALQHQVGAWEGATATNQTTISSAMAQLGEDLEHAKTRVGVYGGQVTALVDQIDQNNRQYDKLLTQFQDSLVGFKGVIGDFKMELSTEKKRATQEEGTLAKQLREQQETLDQVSLGAKEILVLQKRLNQLHGYINQVRDKVTADTAALESVLKTEATDNFRDLATSLEERYQQMGQTAPSTPAFTEHLQALEERVAKAEASLEETVKALQKDIQQKSVGMQAGLNTQETENFQALVLSLEERYQQLTQIPASTPAFTEHLQALEERVEKSEKQYAETVKGLHEDIQELSGGMQAGLKTQDREKMQALFASLEERYQQLAQAPSSNPALAAQLEALEEHVEQSEKHYTETVAALQQEVQTISGRMVKLTNSISAETVEALHHDIQEVSAGMLKLAQSISHLEKTKSSTTPIHAGSITAPQGPR